MKHVDRKLAARVRRWSRTPPGESRRMAERLAEWGVPQPPAIPATDPVPPPAWFRPLDTRPCANHPDRPADIATGTPFGDLDLCAACSLAYARGDRR